MGIATKIKTYGTVLMVLAMVGGWYAMTNTGELCSQTNNYVVSSSWNPAVLPINQRVQIVVTVDGYPLISRSRRISPFGETMAACADSAVIMTATSAYVGQIELDCMIMVNGRMVPRTGFKSIPGPGVVTCEA